MNINLMQNGKEVIALDADDHLLRPVMIRLNFSELRLFPMQVDCVRMRCIPMLHAE
jgi:hypothetical protein